MAALTRFTEEQQQAIAAEWRKPGRPLHDAAVGMLVVALRFHQENLASTGGTLSPEQLQSAGLHFMRLGPVAVLWATVMDHIAAMGAQVAKLTRELKKARAAADANLMELEQLRARCAHFEALHPSAPAALREDEPAALAETWGLG